MTDSCLLCRELQALLAKPAPKSTAKRLRKTPVAAEAPVPTTWLPGEGVALNDAALVQPALDSSSQQLLPHNYKKARLNNNGVWKLKLIGLNKTASAAR